MADELDPVLDRQLEPRIREALRAEAESVQFTLTAQAIVREQRRRDDARRHQRLGLLAAAAVVVVAVAAAVGLTTLRAPSQVIATPSALNTAPPSGVAPSPTASASVSPGPADMLPGDAALLTAAGQGAVPLQTLEGSAAGQEQVVRFDRAPNRGALAIVVACTGGDSVGVAFAADVLPPSDTGGADSPFGARASCDGTPQLVPWGGWNAVFLARGVHAGLSVSGDVVYRAVLVDTSVVAAMGEAAPTANGLPTFGQLASARSDVSGVVIAQHERLEPQSSAQAETDAGDVRGADVVRIVIACRGGSVDVSVGFDVTEGSTTTTTHAALGTPVCDGTLQVFDWTRGNADKTARIIIDSAAGAAWRLVVFGAASATHPNPAVPCGSTASLKAAPPATLYQGGRVVGTAQYSTSAWGAVVDDGVPVVPAEAFDAAAGTPLQLRIAGDVCATGWTVLYGTPGSGGIGVDPVGALALPVGYATTETSRENRIDLPGLPPGDWVLEVGLSFEKGDATGLLRVHATVPGFTFDVQNHSSTGVIVSAAGDAGATLPGFEPGQGGTVTVPLTNPANGIHVEIQGSGCKVLATADYATAAPFTLVVEDGADAGSVKLSTLRSVSSTPIPLPSNGLIGCGG